MQCHQELLRSLSWNVFLCRMFILQPLRSIWFLHWAFLTLSFSLVSCSLSYLEWRIYHFSFQSFDDFPHQKWFVYHMMKRSRSLNLWHCCYKGMDILFITKVHDSFWIKKSFVYFILRIQIYHKQISLAFKTLCSEKSFTGIHSFTS